MSDAQREIDSGRRFAFGSNWRDFLELVDEDRIEAAASSLRESLGIADFEGRTFLDIGCGSGLFSLAACRLGARVHSFDFDAASVDATREMRRRFAPQVADQAWIVEQRSILAEEAIAALGTFDIVYSWGVLHHTGEMWRALDIAQRCVAPGGLFFISIYNDQGWESRVWHTIKRRYNRAGPMERRFILFGCSSYLNSRIPLKTLLRRLGGKSDNLQALPRTRSMSAKHDMIDWVGGYPFEVAKPEQVFQTVRHAGFELRYLKTCAGRIGCNEYVFERSGSTSRSADRA